MMNFVNVGSLKCGTPEAASPTVLTVALSCWMKMRLKKLGWKSQLLVFHKMFERGIYEVFWLNLLLFFLLLLCLKVISVILTFRLTLAWTPQ